jgi:peptide-methionine (S)-S-oxide reductase
VPITFHPASPILRVARLDASVDYYTRVLGFSVDWIHPGIIASVSRGSCNLMLSEGDQGHAGSWVWMGVGDAEALVAEVRAAGARIRQEPTNFSWALEAQLEDLDGNVLRVGSEPRPDRPYGPWLDMHGVLWGGTAAEPLRQAAVALMDADDLAAFERLLAEHPELACTRFNTGEGYFRWPFLLWYVAENPVRTGRLPSTIVAMARAIAAAARAAGATSLSRQLDYAVVLVATGRVPRESGRQAALIDVLLDEGATPGGVDDALAHGELAAARHLIDRGAPMSLAATLCLDGTDQDVMAAALGSSDVDRRRALMISAVCGRADAIRRVLAFGVDINAYGPPGCHAHSTALHQAVNAGSLDAVRALVEAGADLQRPDAIYKATPLGWAEHLGRDAIAAYLRANQDSR